MRGWENCRGTSSLCCDRGVIWSGQGRPDEDPTLLRFRGPRRPGRGLPWAGGPGRLWAPRFWEVGSERSSPALSQGPSPSDKRHCQAVRQERGTRSKVLPGVLSAPHQSLEGPEDDHRVLFPTPLQRGLGRPL